VVIDLNKILARTLFWVRKNILLLRLIDLSHSTGAETSGTASFAFVSDLCSSPWICSSFDPVVVAGSEGSVKFVISMALDILQTAVSRFSVLEIRRFHSDDIDVCFEEEF